MQDQISHQLLLPRARWGEGTTAGKHTESPEQLDARIRLHHHSKRLHALLL